MIHDVDESLRALVRRDALNGSDVEISFDAPTKEWAARRNAPNVNLYLYDIREDLELRSAGLDDVRGEKGFVVERRRPPRRFRLSYLATAWTQRPEDEHRLLASLLGCFLTYEALPADVLQGSLLDLGYAVNLAVALPPSEDRSLSDVWTALGGELKPSLDLVITAPFVVTAGGVPAGPPVLEEPRISVERKEEEAAARQRGPARTGRRGAPAGTIEAGEAGWEETISRGKESRKGRIVRVRGISRP